MNYPQDFLIEARSLGLGEAFEKQLTAGGELVGRYLDDNRDLPSALELARMPQSARDSSINRAARVERVYCQWLNLYWEATGNPNRLEVEDV